MDNNRIYKREFLNEKSGTAFVETTVSFVDPTDSWGSEFLGDLKISDCNRMINLEFYCSSNEEKEERLKKLNKLSEHIAIIRAALMAYEAKPKKKKKKGKKK